MRPIAQPRPRAPLATLGLLAAVNGCAPTDPLEALPPGTLLVAPARPALDPLVERLSSWTDTRVAASAALLSPTLAACTGPVSLRQVGETPTAVDCGISPELAPLAELAVGHAAAFALAEAGPGRLVGTLDIDADGSFRAVGELPAPATGTVWDLLIPGEQPPGPFVLTAEGAVVHARVQQAHIPDLGELVADEGQGQQLFALKSDLFAATVLGGTWELGVWPGRGEGRAPLFALAVGVRSELLARSGMEEWIDALALRWSFAVEPWSQGAAHGQCISDLKLLPELAPCWALVPDHVVVAWNADSLVRALEAPQGGQPRSGLLVDLGAFPAVDAALTRAFAPGEADPAVAYPWRTLGLQAWQADGRLHAELVGRR